MRGPRPDWRASLQQLADIAAPPERIVPVELGVPAPLQSHLLTRPQFPPLRTSQRCGIVNHSRGVSGGSDQAPKLCTRVGNCWSLILMLCDPAFYSWRGHPTSAPLTNSKLTYPMLGDF